MRIAQSSPHRLCIEHCGTLLRECLVRHRFLAFTVFLRRASSDKGNRQGDYDAHCKHEDERMLQHRYSEDEAPF